MKTASYLETDELGFYGDFGGAYIPELLRQNVENLERVFPKNSAVRFISSAKIYVIPARTKSTTPSARFCWRNTWEKPISLPKPAPDSMAWQPQPCAH